MPNKVAIVPLVRFAAWQNQLIGTFAGVSKPKTKITMDVMKTCPYCQASTKQVKSGFNPSGSQRYLCKHCDRIYTPKPNPNGYSVEVRQLAVKMHEDGFSYRAIGRKLDVGTQSVANWVHAYTQKEILD